MKKSLKKSEIIENLHRVLGVKTIDIYLFSIIQLTQFHVRYVMIIHFSNVYQVIVVELNHGWIEYTVGNAYNSNELPLCEGEYYRTIANN